jgi:hypothetical protein
VLAAGAGVPRREGFVLEERLGGFAGPEVWVAAHAHVLERRVYKLAATPEAVSGLKREAGLDIVTVRLELRCRAPLRDRRVCAGGAAVPGGTLCEAAAAYERVAEATRS